MRGCGWRHIPASCFDPGRPVAGRGSLGGSDVWEVARVLREQPDGEPGLVKAAELTGLALHQIRAAARYYDDYGDEIDGWIDEVDRLADDLRPQAG